MDRTKNDLQGYFVNLKPVWPFFGLLTVAMIILYGLTLSADPLMRQPLNLLLFTLLMLVHTGLHWISPSVGLSRVRSAVYMLLQVVLVVVLILFTHSQTLVLGLFMGLSGETLGVIRPLRRSLVAILFLVLVAFALQGIVFGWAGIWPFMVTVVPMTFFVVIYVYLFTRQLEEKTRAEALLKELETAHRQLREYANRIEELTLTTERQRMARELHDTLAQGLAGVILQLEAAGEHLGQGHNEKAAAIVKQASSRARDTLAEARQVIDDLRSRAPDERQPARLYSRRSGPSDFSHRSALRGEHRTEYPDPGFAGNADREDHQRGADQYCPPRPCGSQLGQIIFPGADTVLEIGDDGRDLRLKIIQYQQALWIGGDP